MGARIRRCSPQRAVVASLLLAGGIAPSCATTPQSSDGTDGTGATGVTGDEHTTGGDEETTGGGATTGEGGTTGEGSTTGDGGTTGDDPSAAQRQHPFPGAPEDQALIDEVLEGWYPEGEPSSVIYVAPPDGGPDGVGTVEDPRHDLIAVISEAQAGDHIYLAPGVYLMDEIREQFGHDVAGMETEAHGVLGDPIVVTTDPELFDLQAGEEAVLDFQYANETDVKRTASFWMMHDFWLVKDLEMRNMIKRGIWLAGFDNVISNCHFHHADTAGTNNEAFVLVAASGRPTNNVIMGNHMHHIGIVDDVNTGVITDYGGVNVGCVYTETRQGYDSVFPDPVDNPTPEEYEAGKLPPDSHVYIYNNLVHHARMGLATKTLTEGPYFFLSNVIRDTEIGIRSAFRHSVIRNNVISPFEGDMVTSTGLVMGQFVIGDGYLKNVVANHEMEISHNTIVGYEVGLNFRGGWSTKCHNNLVVGEVEGVHFHRNQYYWYDGGAWPGIRGEVTLGDLDDAHPYYDMMPDYLQVMAGTYKRISISDNCYTSEPIIAAADFVQPENDITGSIVDDVFQVIPPADVEGLFTDPASGDYSRALEGGLYPECGSHVGPALAISR